MNHCSFQPQQRHYPSPWYGFKYNQATSSIDPESEAVIQYAIEKLIDKRTSIIIAHRLSTIRHADNIMVLDKGKIAEFGAHDALLKIEDGHYKELYEMQFMQLESWFLIKINFVFYRKNNPTYLSFPQSKSNHVSIVRTIV